MFYKLKEIEFHDSGLISLNIDFDQLKIEIIIEKEVDSPHIVLIFEQVSSLKISELGNLNQLDSVEIHSAEFDEIGNTITANFIFLLGFGNPDWMLEFSFKSVKIA